MTDWRRIIHVFVMGASIILFGVETSGNSYIRVPLEIWVKGADLIVIGRAVDIKRGYKIAEIPREVRPGRFCGVRVFRIYFEVGKIAVEDVLKDAPLEEGDEAIVVGSMVSFWHGERRMGRKSPFDKWTLVPDMAVGWADVKYEEGDHGIWILKRGKSLHLDGTTHPFEFLPLDSLEVVKRHIRSKNWSFERK